MMPRPRFPFRFATIVTLGASAVCFLATSGCITGTSIQTTALAQQIEDELGYELEREVGVRLGRLSVGLGKLIVKLATPDDEDVKAANHILSGLHRVEVSVYHAADAPGEMPLDLPARVERAMARGRFVPAVRVRENDHLAWVFCRLEDERLRGVTVVSLEEEELTVVRLSGRLDRALSAAIALARDAADDEGDLATLVDAGPAS